MAGSVVDERVLEKLDVIEAKLSDVRELQAKHSVQLEDHMRRTEASEKNLELLRADFGPVKLHVAVMGALAKGLGLVGTLVGIAAAVWKLLGH